MPDHSSKPAERPVSVVIDRDVLPGKKSEFEAALRGIIAASSQFPGYLGTDVHSPDADADHNYRIVVRFDSLEHLRAWEDSKERQHWIEQIDPLMTRPAELNVICGLETWFAQPRARSFLPPPRHKMAMVTWLAITPLLIALNLALAPVLGQLGMVPRLLLSTPLVVLIMTYALMPFMVKVFAGWLYPRPGSPTAS